MILDGYEKRWRYLPVFVLVQAGWTPLWLGYHFFDKACDLYMTHLGKYAKRFLKKK